MTTYNIVNPDGTVFLSGNDEQAATEIAEAVIAYADTDVEVVEIEE